MSKVEGAIYFNKMNKCFFLETVWWRKNVYPDYTWSSTSPATCFSANFSTHTTHKAGLVKHFSNHSLCFVQDRLHSTNLSSGFFLWNSSTQHRPISSLSMSGHFHRLQFYCVPYLGHSFQQQLPWCLFLLFSHGNSIIYIRRVICYPAF